MNRRSAMAEIRARCPEVVADSIRSLGEGDFCAAFLVNGAWVFRFAKHEAAAASLLREACLLPHLAGGFDLRIPAPQIVRSEREPVFVAYPLLPGPVLTRSRYARLSAVARHRCAAQFAGFLDQFHATDLALARSCGVPVTNYHAQYEAVLAQARRGLFAKLTPADQVFIEQTIGGYLASAAPTDFRPVLLHGDLSPAHVLYDPGTAALTGIIDFGDMAIGDPAWDFVYLYEDYGLDMFGRVARAYVGVERDRLHPLLERVARFVVLTAIAWAVTCAEEVSPGVHAAIAQLGHLRAQGASLVREIVAAGTSVLPEPVRDQVPAVDRHLRAGDEVGGA